MRFPFPAQKHQQAKIRAAWAAPWMVSKGWQPHTPRPTPMANGLPRPPEPRRGGGGGRGPTPGAWKRFKAHAAEGRKRGLSRGLIKRLLIGNSAFNCVQRAPGLGLSRPGAFLSCRPVSSGHHRVRGGTELEHRVMAPSVWCQGAEPQAGVSGGPRGICKVTQSFWALDLSSGNQKKGFQSSGSQQCRPGVGLGAAQVLAAEVAGW